MSDVKQTLKWDKAALIGIAVWLGFRFFQSGTVILSPANFFAWIYAQEPGMSADLLAQMSFPLFIRFIGPLYENPWLHASAGIVFRAGQAWLLYCIFKEITKDPRAALCGTFMTAIFLIRFPQAYTYELLQPNGYLSFRAAGTLMGLGAGLALLRGYQALAGLLIALALVVFHPRNSFAMCLAFCLFPLVRGKIPTPANAARFLGPVAAGIVLFQLIRVEYACQTPISGTEWWLAGLNNEPDDISVWYDLWSPRYRFSLLITAALGVSLWIKIAKEARALIGVGCGLYALGLLLESLYVFLPARLLDFLVPIQFAKMKLFPILGSILILSQAYVEFGGRIIKRVLPRLAPDQRVIGLGALLLGAALYPAMPGEAVPESGFSGLSYSMDESRHYPASFSVPDGVGEATDSANQLIRSGSIARGMRQLMEIQNQLDAAEALSAQKRDIIPESSIFDIAHWMRAHLPENAGVVAPPYIRSLKAASRRSMFLSEKIDAGGACLSRCQATRYLKRFRLLLGTDPVSMPGIVFSGGSSLRERYLSIDKTRLKDIFTAYPDYGYLLTEKAHHFDLPVIYSNGIFVLYRWEI